MTATDLPTLIAARSETIGKLNPDDSVAGAEFVDVCGTREDYIREVRHEKP